MSSICNIFKQLSLATWNRLKEAHYHEAPMREETITDINILELKKLRSPEIITFAMSKHKEAKNGADWEWWFSGNKGLWFGFRVQAKAINLRTFRFEHLHAETSNNQSFQCDHLIRSSLREELQLIPLFCLYCYWRSEEPISYTGVCQKTCSPKNSLFGCSLTSAFNVQNLRENGFQNELAKVLPLLVPWHCLVGCDVSPSRDLAEHTCETWRKISQQLQGLPARKLDKEIKSPSKVTHEEWEIPEEIYVNEPTPFQRSLQIQPSLKVPHYVERIAQNQPGDLPKHVKAVTVVKQKRED